MNSDAANAGIVFKLDPNQEAIEAAHDKRRKDAINDDTIDDILDGDFIRYVPVTGPDNGVYIASKREVNRGVEVFVGDTVDPEDIYLLPGNARFMAEARTAVPELIAEVRRPRALLEGGRE